MMVKNSTHEPLQDIEIASRYAAWLFRKLNVSATDQECRAVAKSLLRLSVPPTALAPGIAEESR